MNHYKVYLTTLDVEPAFGAETYVIAQSKRDAERKALDVNFDNLVWTTYNGREEEWDEIGSSEVTVAEGTEKLRDLFTFFSSQGEDYAALEKLESKQRLYFAAHVAASVLSIYESVFDSVYPRVAIENIISGADDHRLAFVAQKVADAAVLAINAEDSDESIRAARAARTIRDAVYYAVTKDEGWLWGTIDDACDSYDNPDNKWDWIYDLYTSMYNPTSLKDQYKTTHTFTVAKSIIEKRDFDSMPILADALEEAGYKEDLTVLRERSDLWNLGNWFLWQCRN